jgi:L-asparagine transporter-like permease
MRKIALKAYMFILHSKMILGEQKMKKEKGLSAWHLTMMALGTVIGGSFFLGSSVAIRAAGPSVILAFIVGGGMVYFILFALSEMTVSNPTTGSFRTYASHAFGRGTGFVVEYFGEGASI